MKPSLAVALQYLYPRRLLSRVVRHATRWRFPPLQQWLIRTVVRRYAVGLADAVDSDPRAWPTFNAFFTRPLRPDARPLPADPQALASPSDGTVQSVGEISGTTLVQAKSLTYSLEALLGDDPVMADALAGGTALTLYLAPRDYHRVHLPADATLTSLVHVPGDRFSVSPETTERIRHLFVRNERVAFHFRAAGGSPFAIVMVGALLVGSIETPWTGPVADLRKPGPHRRWDLGAPTLRRGEEIGRFNMGSTVIALFPRGTVHWDEALRPGTFVRCREAIGAYSITR